MKTRVIVTCTRKDLERRLLRLKNERDLRRGKADPVEETLEIEVSTDCDYH